MVDYIKYTSEMANDWSKTWYDTKFEKPWAFKRLLDSSTSSQMQSKLWLTTELQKLNLYHKKVAIIGGWFAHYITPLLIDNLKVDLVHNYDIDEDARLISCEFNKRYKKEGKYKVYEKNVFIDTIEEHYDMIINTACEHMFPMKKIKELNPALDAILVLQSTSETKYDDHINCVSSAEELSKQANLKEIYFSGSKVLHNGMTRFMVIGK